MSDTVLQVGPGVFIIAAVWIAALLLMTMILRAAGSARLGVIPVLLLTVAFTLGLVFFPRSPETPPPFKEIEIVDSLLIGRYVLLAVVSVVFLVAFFMLLPFHFLEPVRAKALRTY
ncbi:transmembrane protein 218 [Austrofundulus limnaeus]|uniref:Transmembrane protein 218 n=1 Tax=Austrofundulus limnaeus TaxID=52670 RepID=A0A2I4BQK6_AUSLI|nr:PREDICTED: transmembrane protein 218 [Austrofundulus limnaeus]